VIRTFFFNFFDNVVRWLTQLLKRIENLIKSVERFVEQILIPYMKRVLPQLWKKVKRIAEALERILGLGKLQVTFMSLFNASSQVIQSFFSIVTHYTDIAYSYGKDYGLIVFGSFLLSSPIIFYFRYTVLDFVRGKAELGVQITLISILLAFAVALLLVCENVERRVKMANMKVN